MNEMNSQEVSEASALNEDQISASASSFQSNQRSTKPTVKNDTPESESCLDKVSIESTNIDSNSNLDKLSNSHQSSMLGSNIFNSTQSDDNRHSQIPPQPDLLVTTTDVKLNGLHQSKDVPQVHDTGQKQVKQYASSSAAESILPEISVQSQTNSSRIKHDPSISDNGQDAADVKGDKGPVTNAVSSTEQASPPSHQLEEEFLRILFDTSKTYKDLDSQIIILRDIDDVEDQVMKDLVRMVQNHEKTCHQCRVNEIQHKQLPLCRACLKHNQVNHARFRTAHPGVNPLHHFRCFILETLERFSRQQRFRCTCEGGCRVDCPCLFPTSCCHELMFVE